MSVYFVTCREANAVKIGSSLEPHGRLREIQLGCPIKLKLEAMLPGSHAEEHALHARFADDRIHGEWFRLTEMIEAIIAANPPSEAPARVPLPGRSTAAERRAARARAERAAAQLAAEREREHAREMRRLETRGDIHFPFRRELAE